MPLLCEILPHESIVNASWETRRDYNQDLKIGYHEGHAVINDVIELENNYTETNFDGWRQH